jgi:hypothetical protein
MFEYIVHMPLPVKFKGQEDENQWIEVAKYNFDPGLQINDEVELRDIHYGGWGDKPFSFTAMVIKKTKTIKPQRGSNDIFCIDIFVELADKEELERMRDIFKRHNPGKFED